MNDDQLLGIGFYTAADAQRLIAVPARTLRRWLLGHRHARGETAALWSPGVPQHGKALELSRRASIVFAADRSPTRVERMLLGFGRLNARKLFTVAA